MKIINPIDMSKFNRYLIAMLALTFIVSQGGAEAQDRKPDGRKRISISMDIDGDSIMQFVPGEWFKGMGKFFMDGDSVVTFHNFWRNMGDSIKGMMPQFSEKDFEQFRNSMIEFGRQFRDENLMQIDDSAGLFKLPGMMRGGFWEMFGDSAVGRFHPGQMFMSPPDRPNGERPQSKRLRVFPPQVTVEAIELNDISMLEKGGVKRSLATKPEWNAKVDFSYSQAGVVVIAKFGGDKIKKLDAILLDDAGNVVSKESVKNITGDFSRIYAVEVDKPYFIIFTNGKNMYGRKIMVTKNRFLRILK